MLAKLNGWLYFCGRNVAGHVENDQTRINIIRYRNDYADKCFAARVGLGACDAFVGLVVVTMMW